MRERRTRLACEARTLAALHAQQLVQKEADAGEVRNLREHKEVVMVADEQLQQE